MIPADIIVSLEKTESPLRVALQLVRPEFFADDGRSFLLEVLARFGQRVNADNVREILRLAQHLDLSHEQARALLEWLPEDGNNALKWIRSILLEKDGRFVEAANILDTIPDMDWDEARAERLLARARNLVKGELWSDAYKSLHDLVEVTNSYRILSTADKLLTRLREHQLVPSKRQCRIGLVGNMTLDFIVPVMRMAYFATGVDAQIYQGAFGQYQQEILNPNSELTTFRPEIVIIAINWESLGLPDESTDPVSIVREKVSMLRHLWRQCRERMCAFVIQYNLEIPVTDPYGRLSAALSGGRARLLREINLELWKAAQEEPGVAILDVDQIAALYGKMKWSDPTLWHVAKQYPTPEATPLLSRHLVALSRAVLGLTSKCLVLDLDGTLWGGVIGEDGIGGIVLGGTAIGEAYVAFQRYVQSLQRRGIILAVCSKNNEADAQLPFREHPEMVLTLDDITLFVANWRPKDDNLRLIAKTLNIGLDSLVLVDDSPTERAWIRSQIPDIQVVEMPADPSLYIEALDRQMHFEALSLTTEDRLRTASYRENLQRSQFERTGVSLEEFLNGLEMQVELRPFDEANLPRIAQLINKTNQFNLTARRMSESQVRNLIGCPQYYTQYMRLKDRFGDNGLTGILIAFAEGDSLRIDNWLMSCRVLGRRVEEVMLGTLIRYAHAHGFRFVLGEYIPTAKNGLVAELFERMGFEFVGKKDNGERQYRWNVLEKVFELPDCFQIDNQTMLLEVSSQ